MRRINLKLAFTFLFLILASHGLLLAAAPAASTPLAAGKGTAWTLPKGAVPGSTPERRAALARLTPEQRKQYQDRLAAAVGAALRAAHGQAFTIQKPAATAHAVRPDLFGKAVQSFAPGASQRPGLLPLTAASKSPKRPPLAGFAYSGTDVDGDGLPDDFEGALGDAFTPAYHVSAGEQPGTGFALFGDFTPQTVIQNLPAVPPTSHFRVTPLGFANDSTGRQLGFLQIDYLSFWNRDDGLQIGDDCRFYAGVLGGLIGLGITDVLDGLQSHAIDDERSAVLVAAPTTAAFQYSSDPDVYQAYDYYTAAHEDTFFDHSAYLGPTQTVPAYNHLNLALSRAKHGTYTFNPDGFPLFPEWVIDTTYLTIDELYFDGYIDDYDELIYLGMADALYYSCVIEHFQDQGGAYADPRINVGELSHPLNASGFILDAEVQSKLTPLLWQIQ
jgi:hypothetical protein